MVVTSSSEPIPNSLPTCLLTWLGPQDTGGNRSEDSSPGPMATGELRDLRQVTSRLWAFHGLKINSI